MLKVSILIKTLNEEEHIEKCIQSAYRALRHVEGDAEIIVADAISSDSTVEIAMRLGVKVVQLKDMADRGCGSGVQLGYQHASGQYTYFLDGDMEIEERFLLKAIRMLDSEKTLAGVSGILRDQTSNNFFDRRRIQIGEITEVTETDWLDGGGLYRREAIEQAGNYAGNRNLSAYEEAELGIRLRSIGWKLIRIPVISVYHTGNTEGTLALILRLWRSGRMDAAGELLRAAIGKPWMYRVLRLFRLPLCTIAFWLFFVGIVSRFGYQGGLMPLLSLSGACYLILAVKKRSMTDALLSPLLWNMQMIGLIRGCIRKPRSDPGAAIPSTVVAKGNCLDVLSTSGLRYRLKAQA